MMMMKEYEVQQIKVGGKLLCEFKYDDIWSLVANYDEHRFEGEWMVLDKKSCGARDFYHRIKISEEEYKEYLKEKEEKDKARRKMLAEVMSKMNPELIKGLRMPK